MLNRLKHSASGIRRVVRIAAFAQEAWKGTIIAMVRRLILAAALQWAPVVSLKPQANVYCTRFTWWVLQIMPTLHLPPYLHWGDA